MSLPRKKILWLVSWYPNRYDAFDGDFIQRHARAAALYNDVRVLFIKQDEKQEKEAIEENREGDLSERIVYLPKNRGLPAKFSSQLRWRRRHQEEIQQLVREWKPDLIHVHIPWKVGLMAMWAQKKFGIPFLVTEHWGIYNRTVADHIHTQPFLMRFLLKRIYQQAKAFTTVSQFLGEGVNHNLLPKPYTVIPNVVDTTLFYPGQEKASVFTFLHVSNMVPLKNVEGILEAFMLVQRQVQTNVRLVLVGNRDEHYVRLAGQMGLLNVSVFFRGEVPYKNVAHEMQAAHVLVLNSDMENSPCVIGEALCCGLPVIATAVGGIPELVTPQNSLLVPPRDIQALATAMLTMSSGYKQFASSANFTAARQRFSPQSVGMQFQNLYNEKYSL